ncbi:glycoside hydrolase family 79 protein [Sporormia fimetaria CBS 119925]|uniref:Glycoside hydrolase family 79 protein n=1 Tax=Sporormia fimetaria CBS 119925 TaxID=1340428 RepID=A0A6A6VJA2_9PLEO|nr:glycoside hydrolase family 79 protein [Sporormia fimetaria CBS 119925]
MVPIIYITFVPWFIPIVVARQPYLLSASPNTHGAPVSNPLSSSFAGFGIESTNLFAFTGAESPNNFSIQLFQNLANYAGAPPHIRLGGNTQDYMLYDKNHDGWYWKWNENSKAQGAYAADSVIYGPRFFEALERLPARTPVTFGLNLAYSGNDYREQIVKAAKAARDGMRKVRLYSFEIGNEVDLYLQNEMRRPPWDGNVYKNHFLDRAQAVYDKVLKPAGLPSTFFEAPATASTMGNSFEIAKLVKYGLLKPWNGLKFVTAWNQHDYFYFISVTPGPLSLDRVMNLDGTNSQFAYWKTQVDVGLNTGLPYVLREMSSVGPIGEKGVSDTFGAALWTLNFFLYAATLDISSVQMHMTDNSFAAAWQPTEREGTVPYIRPQYYAHAAMAQIIGNGNGTTQIGVLDTYEVDRAYKGRIRAYAAYSRGDLQAYILINTKPANASQPNRGSYHFELEWPEWALGQQVYHSYLSAPGADSTDGVTFNGIAFSNENGKPSEVDAREHTTQIDRNAISTIALRDSEAVILRLGKKLGVDPVVPTTDFTPAPKKKKKGGAWSRTSEAWKGMWAAVFTTTLVIAAYATDLIAPR